MADNVATVQAIYAAFGAGDIAAILAHLDEDVAWEHDWGAGTLELYRPRRGRAEVPGFFAALQAVEITRFEPVNFLAGGDQVAVPIRLEARVRANGRHVRDYEMHLWTFGAGGRVVAFRHLADTWQWAAALGA